LPSNATQYKGNNGDRLRIRYVFFLKTQRLTRISSFMDV
jgi:hypothetical protein